jgi:DNA-binding NtrC family response regulator
MPAANELDEGPLSAASKTKLALAAACDLPLLLEGETGTGKSYAAGLVHRLSERGRGPFIPVNCATIPESLADAELFGAIRGAFTGLHADRTGLIAAAHGGSLFLDEVLELSPLVQPKLLGFLEDGMIRRLGDAKSLWVGTRVICATHRDVNGAVQEGTFREDLYYRIAGIRIRLEPLRERRDELRAIARHLLGRIARRMHPGSEHVLDLSEDAYERLMSHPWPGNTRQLEQALAVGYANARSRPIRWTDIPDSVLQAPRREAERRTLGSRLASERYIRTLAKGDERQAILLALSANGGRRASTAVALGMSRQTLWERMRAYGLIGLAFPQDGHPITAGGEGESVTGTTTAPRGGLPWIDRPASG